MEVLDKLKSSGQFAALDLHLALFFTHRSILTDSLEQARFAFLVAWLSAEVRTGHVCIDLAVINKHHLSYRLGAELANELFNDLALPNLNDWLALCDKLGDEMVSMDGEHLSPFILQANQLYFQRMWLDEKCVADYFTHVNGTDNINIPDIQSLLADLFVNDNNKHDIDWQKVAVATAITRKVTIISGGPGTGKTTTVSKILAALVAIHQTQQSSSLRIVAAAPTGKAAARLTESLSTAVAALTIEPTIKQRIPIEAVTLHRLLGARINSNQYLYNQYNLLNVDVLLIDEASMVDLPMMASVIEALPAHTKLILLGDKEQLSSVEAGAVFGDLCELMDVGYSQHYTETIKALTGYQLTAKQSITSIADSVCLLQKSYRFDDASGIGQLANLIKAGQSQLALTLFGQQKYPDIHFEPITDSEQYHTVIASCVEGYQYYLRQIKQHPNDIAHILACFGQFRLLCALREGPFGVQGLNKIIENALYKQSIISLRPMDAWYIGRPIMILKNSFSLGLYNGDIGITLPAVDEPDKLRVYFMQPNGEIKGYSPLRLPEHETAYAMTIHKSQGSEFDRVAIILPTEYSPLLSRSLLYTAVTRAKQHIAIYADSDILQRTIKSKIQRQSGLLRQIINHRH